MADKVVLSEMVVKITGENTDYQRKLKQGEEGSKKFGREVQNSGASFQRTFEMSNKLAGGLPPQLNLAAKGLQSMGVGGGIALTALAGAMAVAKRFTDELHKTNAAANAAFQSAVSGAKSLREAVRDIRVDVLTKGFEEINKHVNPEGWGDWFQVGFNAVSGLTQGTDGLGAAVNRIVGRVDNVRDAFRRLAADPRIQELNQSINIERGVNAADSRAQDAAAEAMRSRLGLVGHEAELFAESQRLARQASISLMEAMSRLAGSHNAIRASAMETNRFRLSQTIRGLEEEAARSNLLETASRRMGMAQEFARENMISLAEATRMLTPELDRAAEAMQQTAANRLTLSLREQVQLFGLSAEAAQLMRLRLDGVSESSLAAAAAHVEQLQALRRLQAPMDRIEGTVASSADAQFRIADFQRQRAFEIGAAQIQVAPQRTGEAALAGSAEAGGRAAEVPQILRDIRTILRRQGNNPITFTAANLEE